jgi:hypothetical protein
VRIWGTQPDAIDEAEDRDRWMALLTRLDIRQPEGGVATNEAEALQIANRVRSGIAVLPAAALGHLPPMFCLLHCHRSFRQTCSQASSLPPPPPPRAPHTAWLPCDGAP